jgi:hypothetical protein
LILQSANTASTKKYHAPCARSNTLRRSAKKNNNSFEISLGETPLEFFESVRNSLFGNASGGWFDDDFHFLTTNGGRKPERVSRKFNNPSEIDDLLDATGDELWRVLSSHQIGYSNNAQSRPSKREWIFCSQWVFRATAQNPTSVSILSANATATETGSLGTRSSGPFGL